MYSNKPFSSTGAMGGGAPQWATQAKQPASGAPQAAGSSPSSRAPQGYGAYSGPDSVTYAQPGGGWGHTPTNPSQGRAQPLQPRPQGTPYGAYASPVTSESYGDPRGGLATQSPANRPPPFQVQAQTPWGQSNDPFVQRDAFVNQLNQQRIQRAQDFNSAGSPQGSPWLNYGQAAQQAGVFSPQPADGLISRLNQQYGQPTQPQVNYYPGFDPRTQTPTGQPIQPGGQPPPASMERMPTYGYPQSNASQPQVNYYPTGPGGFPTPPPSQGQPAAGYGTPPDRRGDGRTMQFLDKDGDGTDDRDQDGPGMPSYGQGRFPPQSASQQIPSAPQTQAKTAGSPIKANDPNRAKFLQRKAAGVEDAQVSTYGEYVQNGIDNATAKVLASPLGQRYYEQYQSASPDAKQQWGAQLESLIYAEAASRGVDPGEGWMASKTGQSSGGRRQYFDDSMGRYAAKQAKHAKDEEYHQAMRDKYLRGPYDPQGQVKFQAAIAEYNDGRPQAIAKQGDAQSIPAQSQGMPYDYGFNLPPGTTPADIRQSYNARQAARESAAPASSPAFTYRPWQARR